MGVFVKDTGAASQSYHASVKKPDNISSFITKFRFLTTSTTKPVCSVNRLNDDNVRCKKNVAYHRIQENTPSENVRAFQASIRLRQIKPTLEDVSKGNLDGR